MKIAAFNIQKFGNRKLSDPAILNTLIKRVVRLSLATAGLLDKELNPQLIVSRYDIVVILEVVDASGKAVDSFLKELNKANPQRHYRMQLSVRLGRTTYKEQYLFLYRDAVVNVTDTYQYEDNQPGDVDAFDREPYILRFSSPNTVVKDLVLVPVHTKPEDSEKEVDELYDVVMAVKAKWKTDNIMLLGDFNADGSYVSKKEMKAIRIYTDQNFHWLIKDKVDTTTSTKNDHTYDRIVVYGQKMIDAVVPNSAKPFNFQQEYGLTEADALKVSDHYPVEVELKESKSGAQRPATQRK